MMMFEMTFLGLKFIIIRLLVAIPLVTLAGDILGAQLEKQDYEMDDPSES